MLPCLDVHLRALITLPPVGCDTLLVPNLISCPQDWVYLSLQVLVTACPCALVLSTPATVVCALARSAQHGVLIKSGAALEALRRVSVEASEAGGRAARPPARTKPAQCAAAFHQKVQ